jgi:hypothetical protein
MCDLEVGVVTVTVASCDKCKRQLAEGEPIRVEREWNTNKPRFNCPDCHEIPYENARSASRGTSWMNGCSMSSVYRYR